MPRPTVSSSACANSIAVPEEPEAAKQVSAGELLHHPAGAAAVVRCGERLGIQQPLLDERAVVLEHRAVFVRGRGVTEGLAVLAADHAVPEAPAGARAEGVSAVVDQRLPLEAVGQGERIGVFLLDEREPLMHLLPGGGDPDAHVLPDVRADDQREGGDPDLLQAREHVVLPVGLAQVLHHLAEVPLLHILAEVGHVLDVVAHRQDRAGGDERGLVPAVDQRDDTGGITGADQQAALLHGVAEGHMGELDPDIRQLLDAVEDLPRLRDRLLGPVRPQHRHGDRFSRRELLSRLVPVHRADVQRGSVDLLLRRAAAGGQGERAGGRGGQPDESATAGERWGKGRQGGGHQ